MEDLKRWKCASELDAELENVNEEGLGELYALSRFLKSAVFTPGYEADAKWLDLLVFTDAGEQIRKMVKGVIEEGTLADVNLALFRLFAYHDLIFDWTKSNREGIEKLLGYELGKGKLLLPYRFGRLLYDHFNDRYEGSKTEHLAPAEVYELLADTPNGVYQMNSLLTGPLGLVHSFEQRYLPPSLSLPLWHCSDTGCRQLHSVQMLPPDIPLTTIDHKIRDELKDLCGPPSEWAHCLTVRYLQARAREEHGLKYYDLPVLIADSIIGKERTALVEAALASEDGVKLREILSASPRKSSAGKGPAHKVAQSLAPEEQVQLLLILNDSRLVHLIDELTLSKVINVSLGQIRTARQAPHSLSLSARSELSGLGLRSVKEEAVTNFVHLVKKAYEENDILADLIWRLRARMGTSPVEGLLSYLETRSPEDAVRDLVLTSQAVTEYVFVRLELTTDAIKRDVPTPVDLILWKMGFDPPQYDDFSLRFQSHLERFNGTVLSMPGPHTEDDREKIRATGVNLFVYVEKLLDMVLSYNVWLLATDHFLDSRFDFDIVEARKKVSEILGSTLTDDDSEVWWNPVGDNSLGVLLRYLSESVSWMNSLESEDHEAWRRSQSDIPHFAKGLEARFPFNHVTLWADADLNEFRAYVQDYRQFVGFIEQANLAFVRNGLDHMRDATRFPSSDKMLACAARLREAHNFAAEKRFLPVIFWLERVEESRFGMSEYHLRDSAGRLLVLHGPPMALCLRPVGFSRPYVVAPGNLLGGANAPLVFGYRERTEYEEYWKDYPRRRRIAQDESDSAET